MKKNETQIGIYQQDDGTWWFTISQTLADPEGDKHSRASIDKNGFTGPGQAYFAAAEALAALKPV